MRFHCVMGWETQRNCTFIFILFFCKITQQKHDFVVFLVEKNNIIIFPLWNDFFNILFALYYNMQMQRNISNDLWLHQHVMMQSWLNDNSNLRKQRLRHKHNHNLGHRHKYRLLIVLLDPFLEKALGIWCCFGRLWNPRKRLAQLKWDMIASLWSNILAKTLSSFCSGL